MFRIVTCSSIRENFTDTLEWDTFLVYCSQTPLSYKFMRTFVELRLDFLENVETDCWTTEAVLKWSKFQRGESDRKPFAQIISIRTKTTQKKNLTEIPKAKN